MKRKKARKIIVYDVFREIDEDVGEVFTIITPRKKIKTKKVRK